MVNIALVITGVVLLVLLLFVNTYMLAYFCHPDDKGFGAGVFCKLVVVIGC